MKYNEHTRPLQDFAVNTTVLIQGKNKKWVKQGVIMEKLDNRQYRVKVHGSGRVTLQNRRFLRPCHSISPPSLPTYVPTSPPSLQPTSNTCDTIIEYTTGNTSDQQPAPALPDNNTVIIPASTVNIPDNDSGNQLPSSSAKTMPRSLRNLGTYNKPGLNEQPVNPEGRRVGK